MKHFFTAAVIYCITISSANAQTLDMPPNGGNPKATTSESIGVTDITVKYSRPGVKKRDGKVWGNVVKYGFGNSTFMSSQYFSQTGAPWRAGANETTTISFEHNVKVENRDIKAGTYGLFFALWPDSCMVIFSKVSTSWGSFYYNQNDDALRVTVKPQATELFTEKLKYEFTDQTDSTAVLAMMWEKLKIPISIYVDVPEKVINGFREKLVGPNGFVYPAWTDAARYCASVNRNLEEALEWSGRGISGFGGQKTFYSLSTKANILQKLNRLAESDSLMHEAMAFADANQMSIYARTLLGRGMKNEAMEIYIANEKKHGDVFAVNIGLARGHAANGNITKALEYAEKALKQAKNEQNKKSAEDVIAKLKEGREVN
jgi:Protein of unknown function (DUF2911)